MRDKRGRRVSTSAYLAAACVLAAVIAAAYLLPTPRRMSLRSYFGITGDSEVGITAGGSLSGTLGRVIGGRIYLDYESVTKYVTRALYYDDSESVLITTAPGKIGTLDLSGGTSPGEEAEFLDGVLYISLDYLRSETGVYAETYEDPVRVRVETDETFERAEVRKNTAVREGPGKKRKIIAKLGKGGSVRCADDGDGTWTKVITEDGLIGYCASGSLGERTPGGAPMAETKGYAFEKHPLGEPVNMVFHQTDNQASNDALSAMTAGMSGVNVIAPTWFYLDSAGGDVRDVTSASYVQTAHDAGMQVWAVWNDFDGNVASTEDTLAFLGNYSARMRAEEAVVASLAACGADGLNLDFELVREAGAPAFIEFVREIAARLDGTGLVLSVDNYVPTFTRYMDRGEQAKAADYIVTMCYDEHTQGSAEAGSVSSLPFVENGIRATMEQVPAGQVIAALPFFSRFWTVTGGSEITSRAVGMNEAVRLTEEYGMAVSWDEKTGQNYAEGKEGDILRQIWLEDGQSVREKLTAVRSAGCAGYAWWKLGLEAGDIWGVISN